MQPPGRGTRDRESKRIVSYRTLLLPQSTGPTSHASHTKVHGADRDHSAEMCGERMDPWALARQGASKHACRDRCMQREMEG